MTKIEIEQFNPCYDGLEFRKKYLDFKSAWENCPRGDWMLWIAKKLDVDLYKLTTAKALCANTVRHLMNDERSIRAVDTALLFGERKANKKELVAASDDAYAVYTNASTVAIYAADAAYAAAAIHSADVAAATADAAYADVVDAADATAYADDYVYDYVDDTYLTTTVYAVADRIKIKNQLQTANICRKILTEDVFKKLNIK